MVSPTFFWPPGSGEARVNASATSVSNATVLSDWSSMQIWGFNGSNVASFYTASGAQNGQYGFAALCGDGIGGFWGWLRRSAGHSAFRYTLALHCGKIGIIECLPERLIVWGQTQPASFVSGVALKRDALRFRRPHRAGGEPRSRALLDPVRE